MPRLSKIGAAALAAFGWTSGVSAVTASYLVVAGGGGGGNLGTSDGGGGAGGLLAGTASLNPILSYTITVGAGGSPHTTGTNSIFGTITADGGGLGANTSAIGGNGGSGGGGSGGTSPGNAGGTGSQGSAGGNGLTDGSYTAGGGGGGHSAVGANATTGGAPSLGKGGAGGNGTASSISGSSMTYAGGGGGGSNAGSSGDGGTGGGGNGQGTAPGTVRACAAGTANTGGGGGGGGNCAGGSGVVIISYTSPQKFSGGVVTTSGGNTIHTFTTSGTLGPITPLLANYLVVAGGGGGSMGGGGAGGLLSGSSLTIDPTSTYVVTVGAGGVGGNTGPSSGVTSGSNSSFSAVSTAAVGGGRGGFDENNPGNGAGAGANGGSGGGGGQNSSHLTVGGSGTAGQGNAGGTNGSFIGSPYPGGGGGGAGAVGGNATSNSAAGNGGNGSASSISGTSVTYAGGGGGGTFFSGGTGGAGGTGGGGAGNVSNNANGTSGTANLGGGGGGSGSSYIGGAGGSGVVIISYPGSTQLMAGGVVTIAGGNVIHTFNSTGYLTPLTLLNNSLRFRNSASAYLSRTIPSAPSSRTTMSLSMWVKRGQLSLNNDFLFGTTNNYEGARFLTDDLLYCNVPGGATWITNAVYRDPAAWYHFLFVYDTTNATASERFRLYANGVLQTFGTSPTITQNQQTVEWAVSGFLNTIGNQGTASRYFDGYMTAINFVDGQALPPTSFGTFNSYGVWQPITYGGSYGNNGFYLPFTLPNNSVSANYLVVAGGAGGGAGGGSTGYGGGGGGAGGYRTASAVTLNSNSIYTVTVGAGGGGNASGSGSAFGSFLSSGGGVGGGSGGYTDPSATGGSGGGGGALGGTAGSAGNSGGYSPVEGYAGANAGAVNGGGGGGGGAAASVTAGGAGAASSISGASVTYATGGNGGINGVAVVAGAANTGNGGGGGVSQLVGQAAGGSGVVIISYAGSQKFTGGTVTSSGGNTIHRFTSSGIFSGNIASDYSPQGNNWTTNNISLTAGSTYDSMTDVPTLTSATAANYCTFNPLYPSSTPVDGNLSVVGDSNSRTVAGTMSSPTGKWYAEGVFTSGFATNGWFFVWDTSTPYVPGNVPATTGQTGAYYAGITGNIAKAITGTVTTIGTYSTWTNNDIIGMAFDADVGTISFYKNNTLQTTITDSGFIGRPMTFGIYYYAGSASMNFGQRPFTYTPPSGFVALNTYNL